MSKVFDTLRRNGSVSARENDSELIRPACPTPQDAPEFIELGPKRQVLAASPGVLAGSCDLPLTAAADASGSRRRGGPVPATAPVAPRLRRPRMAAELLAYHAPDHPVVAQYAELLAAMLEAASVKKAAPHPILTLCPIRGDIGCTTVLLNLAIVSARQGRRTLVLDANTKAPAVAARLGLTSAPGLMELLAGDVSLPQAIQASDQEQLFALTAGQQGPLLADVQTLQELLRQLRSEYDLVLIDGPRWDGKPVTLALAQACEALFLVVPSSEAESNETTNWLRTLPQQGIRLAGTILTAQ